VNLDQVRAALVAQAGGYLRNMIVNGTCPTCRTWTGGAGTMCQPCTTFEQSASRPDALGFLTYAGKLPPIEQSEFVMYGYKRPGQLRSDAAYNVVALLTYLGVRGHLYCPGRLVGRPLTHWSTVSSLRGRLHPHPLRDIVAASNRATAEIPLAGTLPPGGNPRDTNPSHFAVGSLIPGGGHILLIDDTWVSGAHVRSATWALREAGAAAVSALSIARWLSTDWDQSVGPWARKNLTGNDFDPNTCPWTGSTCP